MFPSLVSLSIHLAASSDSYFWAYQPLISPFFPLTSSSPELILPSVVATQVEPSIAQSVAAAYYPGVDKCESTAFSPTLAATDGNLDYVSIKAVSCLFPCFRPLFRLHMVYFSAVCFFSHFCSCCRASISRTPSPDPRFHH